ncbi:glycoside hydrolase family 16 protein [Aplosporella prunicola CBS 121167]|uniref:Glycoside hydrolase family 16 protein n=1 Tax=Aplosporella prunicola CBS 121167 TaxID=1176127 RepID=A0A6A6B862_9PEZI|nr:glycoside hydrolase family 16 protein [Aplosporella prunicola CBS 121167]KAF2139455.1 glycoside hydrolase family 16 protein [Aplosporella prunicola CBS 121167]
MKSFVFTVALAAAASATPVQPAKRATETVVPTSCFDSYESFESYFNYLYPWGSDHNGGARMVGNSSDHDYISINDPGTLTLTAHPVTGEPATSSGVAINYLSGTVHAKDQFTVEEGGGYDFNVELQATTTYGTWPAFWLTAVEGWPPEIDLAEWKGSGKVSFNTFNTSSEVTAKDVDYPDSGNFHSFKAELRDENGSDVSIKFYMDDTLITEQVGAGFTGAAMWLIIDLQMEGSSGTSGPDTDTTFSARNLEIISYNP